ncbi:MAG: AAA family ATPase [Candidatus Kariarchaeaceae archaeon]|jgi:MoxR-like ATPase
MVSVDEIQRITKSIKEEMAKRIVGNELNIDLLCMSLFARGHVLLEGVPGIAKSYLASTLAEVLGLEYKRIQFVPDLLPADITGSSIFNPESQEFNFIKGPIFANIILCDEINRAPPKTQAAMLEAMQEAQASVEGTSYILPQPSFVIATQNPIEQVGTYQLPEAQIDRFMIKINMSLPNYEVELELLKSKRAQLVPEVTSVTNSAEIEKIRNLVEQVEISDEILDYIARLVVKTRYLATLNLGGSPRASLALMMLSRARASTQGRNYVEPDDVKQLFYYVINHRLILTPQAEVDQIPIEQIIQNVIKETPVTL